MQRLYSTYPGGTPGIGLLLLRTAAGIATGVCGVIVLIRLDTAGSSQISYISHIVLSLVLITGSVFFILGLMMPFVSITVATLEFGTAYIRFSQMDHPQGSKFGWIALLLLASIAIALTFLGPGAFSIDARLFGRRLIIIPSSKKEDGQEI